MEIQQRLFPKRATQKTHPVPSIENTALERKGGLKPGRKPKSVGQAQPRTPNKPDLDLENHIDTSGDEPEDDDGKSLKANHRKRKSILQPTGSKFSRKAAGRRKSLSFIDGKRDDEEEDSDGALGIQEHSPLPPASHRLTKSHSHTHTDQSIINSTSATYHHHPLRTYMKFKVTDYDLPSFQPQGPGDQWTCAFEGCDHKVYESSTSAGRTEVKEHFQIHAHQAQEKIDLAYKESRPYLPVE